MGSFNGANGANPYYGSLTLSGSTLYGTTANGGSYGDGNVFSINTDGSGFESLLSFSGSTTEHPLWSFTLGGSTLYGMTTFGGANGGGTVFRVNTDGTGFQSLLAFSGSNGGRPWGGLTLIDSALRSDVNANTTVMATFSASTRTVADCKIYSRSAAPTAIIRRGV